MFFLLQRRYYLLQGGHFFPTLKDGEWTDQRLYSPQVVIDHDVFVGGMETRSWVVYPSPIAVDNLSSRMKGLIGRFRLWSAKHWAFAFPQLCNFDQSFRDVTFDWSLGGILLGANHR